MRYYMAHDRMLEDQVLEYMQKLPEVRGVSAQELQLESVGEDGTTIEQYANALKNLARWGRISEVG